MLGSVLAIVNRSSCTINSHRPFIQGHHRAAKHRTRRVCAFQGKAFTATLEPILTQARTACGLDYCLSKLAKHKDAPAEEACTVADECLTKLTNLRLQGPSSFLVVLVAPGLPGIYSFRHEGDGVEGFSFVYRLDTAGSFNVERMLGWLRRNVAPPPYHPLPRLPSPHW